MRLIVLLLCGAACLAESKTDKQIRTLTSQIAELKDQLRKEQGLSTEEKRAASNATGDLARQYAKLQGQLRELSGRLDAATSERDALKLQLQNHQEIDQFQKRVREAPALIPPEAVREIPKIEKKIEANHAENRKALDRNAEITQGSARETKADLAEMRKSITAISNRQVADNDLLSKYGLILQRQATIENSLWWGMVGLSGLVLLSIGTAIYLIRYHLVGTASKDVDEDCSSAPLEVPERAQ